MKNILHIIDNLEKGGAETILVNNIKELKTFNHIVLTFGTRNHFEADLTKYFKLIQLNLTPTKNPIKIIKKITRVINDSNIDIVHTHSYWSNILSRFATSKKITLINHYHFADYISYSNKLAVKRRLFIDKFTFKKNVQVIAVADFLAFFLSKLFKSSVITIPSSINDKNKINDWTTYQEDISIRNIKKGIAIGNLKEEKNYPYLVQAFKKINIPFQLDVYGGGNALHYLSAQAKNINKKSSGIIDFKGFHMNPKSLIPLYDVYVSASTSEVSPVALLEAIAEKKLLLLSDIPAHREIADKIGYFFNPVSEKNFTEVLCYLVNEKPQLNNRLYEAVLEKYSQLNVIKQLMKLYQ